MVQGICAPCGRPDGTSCAPCVSGNPPPERVAWEQEQREKAEQGCVHGCLEFRRHLDTCPVENRHAGAWVAWTEDTDDVRADMLERMCSADQRSEPDIQLLAEDVYIRRHQQLAVWHPCPGCLPRKAEHGPFCAQCHARLEGWLAGAPRANRFVPARDHQLYWLLTTITVQSWDPTAGALVWRTGHTTVHRWEPAVGSLAWAYDWVAGDREPAQSTSTDGKIDQGKKEPPAALALHVHDFRQQLAAVLGQMLRHVTSQIGLTGPDWWVHRVQHRGRRPDSWRSWQPQSQQEITEAQRYLLTWLPRIEEHPALAEAIYSHAKGLMNQVTTLAPWRARAKKLPGLTCPECDRDALAKYDGEVNLVCQRCKAVIPRQKYDRWSYLIESEKEQAS